MDSEVKTTVMAGAEPEIKKTGESGAEPEVKPDGKTSAQAEEQVPWNKDPRWQSWQTEKKTLQPLADQVNALLKANSLEDITELAELVESGAKIRGKIADIDSLDDILAKARKLERYEAYWSEQEEKKRRETEDPDQTIARLENRLKQKETDARDKETQRRESEEAKQALHVYDKEVSGLIKDMDIPKEQRGFILKFFGVDNQANEIDITDRKAIKKLIQDGIKEKEAYDQAIIKAYIDGKTGIPKINATDPAITGNQPKIMLKDARKALHAAMTKITGG